MSTVQFRVNRLILKTPKQQKTDPEDPLIFGVAGETQYTAPTPGRPTQ